MKERLQKLIAHAGITSRRKAEELIRQGRVRVNGKIVNEPGAKADPGKDRIRVDGKTIEREGHVYYALNKPQGVISSVRDEKGRPVVTDLVPQEKRVYPAGRLDFDSEGLMILTNDGRLVRAITQAGRIAKVYRVKVEGNPDPAQLQRMSAGMRLRDGTQLAPCQVRPLKKGRNCWFELTLIQGRNRQIRKMVEEIGSRVMRLRRVAIGPIRLRDLPPGQFRELEEAELAQLEKLLGLKKEKDQEKKSRRRRAWKPR